MKKPLLLTLLALCMVLALLPGKAAAGWAEPPADTEEPQETGSPADTEEPAAYDAQVSGTFALGDTINGAIENKGDTNTYEFALSESGCVTLDITSYMQYYTLELYDGDGSRIWSSTYNEWNSATEMRRDAHKIDLEAGTYRLRVSSEYYSTKYTGSYTIKTSFSPSGANETEPNDSIETADAISVGDTVKGQIALASGKDYDYYQFTLSESGGITLDITSYIQYYTLELYDSNGSRIWSSANNAWNSATGMRNDIHKIDLEAGTYWLRVSGETYSSKYTGNYTIKTLFSPSGANETEPNNSIETANAISVGDTVKGQIALTSSKDYDYYRFTLPVPGGITLDVTSYMQYYTLELYDSNGSRTWSSANNAWNSATGMRSDVHKIDLEAGTYWLCVSGETYSSRYTGNYTIKVDGPGGGVQPGAGYQVNSLTIRDSNGTALTEIPRGNFLASVSITKMTSDSEAMVFLAAYSESGMYKGLMYIKVKDLQPNATFEVTLPVDNASGGISCLKVFVISSFTDLQPLGSAVTFPA